MTSAAELNRFIPGWFTVDDVKHLATDAVFTVVFAGVKPVGQEREMKAVLLFKETAKGLVMSKGRSNQLATLFGQDTLEGKQIRLGVELVKGREQTVILSAE